MVLFNFIILPIKIIEIQQELEQEVDLLYYIKKVV